MVRSPGDFQGAKSSHEQKLKAFAAKASAAARRLVEHYPVGDEHGAPPPRPRTPQELVDYVTWALPRARRLGTRVTPAEARAVGFVHAGFALRQAAAADLEAQRKEALSELSALGQEIEAGSAAQDP